jgi:hypothetical protein
MANAVVGWEEMKRQFLSVAVLKRVVTLGSSALADWLKALFVVFLLPFFVLGLGLSVFNQAARKLGLGRREWEVCCWKVSLPPRSRCRDSVLRGLCAVFSVGTNERFYGILGGEGGGSGLNTLAVWVGRHARSAAEGRAHPGVDAVVLPARAQHAEGLGLDLGAVEGDVLRRGVPPPSHNYHDQKSGLAEIHLHFVRRPILILILMEQVFHHGGGRGQDLRRVSLLDER